MNINSIKTVRTYHVVAPDFAERASEDGEGTRPWLDTTVDAQHEDEAVRVALLEWAEQWPSLSWPREVEVNVLYTHLPNGQPTRIKHPNRKIVTVKK